MEGEGERSQGGEGHPWLLLPHPRALEQAGKVSLAHPHTSRDLWQDEDPTGVRDRLNPGWHRRAGGFGSAEFRVGLNDFSSLFQPKLSHGSLSRSRGMERGTE